MTADERARRIVLHTLMSEHALSSLRVAALVSRTPAHVRAWRSGSAPMPPEMLRLLELELNAQNSTGNALARP